MQWQWQCVCKWIMQWKSQWHAQCADIGDKFLEVLIPIVASLQTITHLLEDILLWKVHPCGIFLSRPLVACRVTAFGRVSYQYLTSKYLTSISAVSSQYLTSILAVSYQYLTSILAASYQYISSILPVSYQYLTNILFVSCQYSILGVSYLASISPASHQYLISILANHS